METERFEALIDAILAIIITIIVLEIPLASNGTWQALLDIKYEFIIYAISFMICFNFWNFNNNIFSIVNKVDPKIIWTMGLTLFVFSLLPYLTTFAAENFYVFFPQFLYGLSFIITDNHFGYDWNCNRLFCISSSDNAILFDFNSWSLDNSKNQEVTLFKIFFQCVQLAVEFPDFL